MVVLRNWLQEFIDISNITNEQIAHAFNSIGFEVEGVVKFSPPKNVVLGHIVSKIQHSNAEKLSVCEVDVGTSILQIVCGAQNVAQGQYVAVAIEGAVMPNGLTITKTSLRGVDSFGMICSAKELGYPDLNDGIWALDESIGALKLGIQLSDMPLLNETQFFVDVTPNRGDALSICGLARELAAYFNLKISYPQAANADENEPGIGRILNVHFTAKSNSTSVLSVARMSQLHLSINSIMSLRLALCELKSQNEYEKICQYVTHGVGVLLNIYPSSALIHKDDKLELNIATMPTGLDDVDGNIKLATIGIEQKIFAPIGEDEVILHAFYVEPEIVQSIKTPQTKTLYLAKRGSEPDLIMGMAYARNILTHHYKALFYFGVLEFGTVVQNKQLKMDVSLVEHIIGEKLDKNSVVNLLTRLSFKVTTNIDFDNCLVDVPSFRHDIYNTHDLAEEVLRLKGLDSIVPKPLPLVNPKADRSVLLDFANKRKLRYKSASAGFYETVHFIFTEKAMLSKLGFSVVKDELDIANPITAELDTLRTSLLPNMLLSAKKNANNSKKRIALFESGVVFDENRNESFKLAYLFSGEAVKDGILNAGKPPMVSFTAFIAKLADCIGKFTLKNAKPQNDFWHPYIYAYIYQNDEQIGVLGKLNPAANDMFDLQDTFLCEIDADRLSYKPQKAVEFSKFQRSIRDLTVAWQKNTAFNEARQAILSLNIKELVDMYAIDWFDNDKNATTANLTIRFIFQSDEKTLSEEEIAVYMSNIAQKLQS